MRPNSATVASTSASHCAQSPTWHDTASARRPRARTSSATASHALELAARDHHVGTGVGEAERHRAPEALAASGDHDDLASLGRSQRLAVLVTRLGAPPRPGRCSPPADSTSRLARHQLGRALEEAVGLRAELFVHGLVGLTALPLGVAALEHDGALPPREDVVPVDGRHVATRAFGVAVDHRVGRRDAVEVEGVGTGASRAASCRRRGGRSAPTRGRPADRRWSPSPSRRPPAGGAARPARTARCRACSRRGRGRAPARSAGGRRASGRRSCAAGRSRPW